jgi:succinate dehydrogenase / fumarate reductase cytochrome b subunit
MTLLGTLLLIFLVIHMADFWLHTKKALYITHEEENPYLQVKAAMQNPLLLVIYIAGFFSLGFHLLHGFPSAFQTLGLNHKKYTPIIKAAGTAFSISCSRLICSNCSGIVFWFGLIIFNSSFRNRNSNF